VGNAFRTALFTVFAWAAGPGLSSGGEPALNAQETGSAVAEGRIVLREAGQAALVDSLSAAVDSLTRRADSLATPADSLSSAGGAPAEEPSEQKAAAEKPEKSPWEGSLGFGLTMNRGNSRQSSLVSNLEVSRIGEKTRFIHQTTVTKTSSEDGDDASKGSFNTKYEINQSKRFFYFTSLDLDYNRQAAIDFRMAPGLGMGISAVASDRCRLSFNFGVNLVTKYLRNLPDRTNGHYLGSQDLRLILSSRTRLDQSLTYKPRFNRTEEYLLDLSVSLTSNLTSSFDLKVNLETSYNSRPPISDPPIRRQDWMLYTAVAYRIWE